MRSSSAVTRRPHCTIVPPYVLSALATSADPRLAALASGTLRVDGQLRRARVAAPGWPARPGGGAARPRFDPGMGPGPQRTVHDAHNGTALPGTAVRGEGDPETGDPAVTEAYDGLGATWRLWREAYGRDSLDGSGLPLLATVHYGRDYDNAFWDGAQMVFGDGDGVVFLAFTRSLDVIGHELAHGVTQYTSGLAYQGQSGALNESVSDVFGVLVKQRLLGQTAAEADWLVGAELLGPDVKGVALRSMAAPGTAYDDPRLGTDPQPAHLRDYVETTDDNGGVHINSGIPNKAFHDLALALGGAAWEVAGQIWYDTVTGRIRADCDFVTFAGLTAAAAAARYGEGSAEARAVAVAWAGVGVEVPADPGGTSPGGTPPEPTAPTDPGGHGDPEPLPSSEVTVRRTGGLAALVRERTVPLGDLPDDDGLRWRTLLGDGSLLRIAEAATGERARPDAFSYAVRCDRPTLDVLLPEPALTEDVRALLERTLADPGHG